MRACTLLQRDHHSPLTTYCSYPLHPKLFTPYYSLLAPVLTTYQVILLLTDGEQTYSFCYQPVGKGRMCGTDAAIAMAEDVQPQVDSELVSTHVHVNEQ